MADYNINAVTRRVVYSGSAGVGPYAFSFEVLSASDIAVYKNATKLTVTTHYTVTVNANGTGSVTLTSAATGSDTITIVGARAIARTTDFVTAGDLLAESVNEQLDSQIIMLQQLAEENRRTLRAPAYDPAATEEGGTLNMTLPAKADRAGKVLAFNASTGNPEAGPTIVDIATVAPNTAAAAASATAAATSASAAAASATSASNSASTATSQASAASSSASSASSSASTATSQASAAAASAVTANEWATKTTSAVSGGEFSAKYHAQQAASSASTASTASSDATASATLANDWATKTSGAVAGGEYSAKYHASAAASSASSAASAKTAAETARDQTLAAFDSFDDRYLGTKSGDPSLDNDGNALVAGALYFNSTSGIMKVYTGSAWVAAYVSGAGFLPLSGGALTGAVTLSTNGSADALRITQTGAGNALVVEDSTNPDATPFVVDASGNLISGYTSTIGVAGVTPRIQSIGTSVSGSSIAAVSFANDATTTATLYVGKSRGANGTVGTVSQSGDSAGSINFVSDDGSALVRAAQIFAAVDGTPGTNDMPGRLVFSTTADGASSPTERMRINNAGEIGIGGSSVAGQTLRVSKVITGATTGYGIVTVQNAQSDVTASAIGISSIVGTAAASFTLTNLFQFRAEQGTIGAGSTVTNQYGFSAAGTLVGATNNYGFHSNIASGTGRWNFYANGTADNYFAGNVGIGTASPGSALDVKGTLRLSGSSSGYVGFAPAAAAGSTTYTLPSADGTSGQMLSTNGSGVLSWATAATGANGNVSIGFVGSAVNSTGSSLVWNSTGDLTWTVPAGVTKCKVTVLGGGGGGGGTSNATPIGAGGGAGGCAIKWVTGLTPGGTVAVTVGAAGTTGSNAAGGAGGTSSFGAFASATGGSGGGRNTAATIQTSGTNGAGSSGDINISGDVKISSVYGVDISNGDPNRFNAVAGADAPLGLGFGGRERIQTGVNQAGAAATGYGAGGGGAIYVTANQAGGAATPGIVIIEW